MSAVREAWTDERLDDLRESVNTGFAQTRADHAELRGELKTQVAELREEMRAGVTELRQESTGLRGEMQAGFERMDRRFDWLTRTIVAALIGLVISHFV